MEKQINTGWITYILLTRKPKAENNVNFQVLERLTDRLIQINIYTIRGDILRNKSGIFTVNLNINNTP